MSGKTILVWFRKDLRIHDNEILTEAVRKGGSIIPVYCFDPRQFELTSFNTSKTGLIRAKFLLESVADLRNSFRAFLRCCIASLNESFCEKLSSNI